MDKKRNRKDKDQSNRSHLQYRLFDHATTAEDRRVLKGQYQATKEIIDVTLRRVLEKELKASIEASEDPEKYKIANWRDHDADQFGYRRALRKILKLLP